MNKYAVTVTGVANVTVGNFNLEKRSAAHYVYMTAAQVLSLKGYCGSNGKMAVTVDVDPTHIAVNATDPLLYTAIAIGAQDTAAAIAALSIGYTGSVGVGYTGSAIVGYTGSASTVIGYTGSAGPIGYSGSAGPIGYTGSGA